MLTGPPPKFHGTWDILVLLRSPVWRERPLTRTAKP